MWYTLDDNSQPVKISISDLQRYEEAKKKHTIQAKNVGDCEMVSTTFLGLDHCLDGVGPILFETMIFGGIHSDDQWRYATWEGAKKGHQEAVNLVLRGSNKKMIDHAE